MIFQSVKMAWKSITSSKMRSFLTMLGIIIGVIALVVLVSLVESATSSVTGQISDMGNDLLTVSISDNKNQPFKLDEVLSLAEDETISEVAPSSSVNATLKSGYNSDNATVYGTTPGYESIQQIVVEKGRFLKSADVDNHTYVVILNAYAATELLGSTDVVGETVAINGLTFTIVGVLEEEDDDSSTSSLSSLFGSQMEAYIPYTTLMRISDSVSSEITTFYAASSNEESSTDAQDYLTDYLLNRLNQDEDAFTISNQSIIAETLSSVTSILSILLGGIAAIALVVGGIGIMNIMLVSVTERTKEIGIRKAIGAGRMSIMLQFLIEALLISLLGCLLGVGISWTILKVVSIFTSDYLTFELSMGVVWIAVAFSAFVGVVFGLYPANKAAKKKPIDALRYS